MKFTVSKLPLLLSSPRRHRQTVPGGTIFTRTSALAGFRIASFEARYLSAAIKSFNECCLTWTPSAWADSGPCAFCQIKFSSSFVMLFAVRRDKIRRDKIGLALMYLPIPSGCGRADRKERFYGVA